jgi:hypothetical protein
MVNQPLRRRRVEGSATAADRPAVGDLREDPKIIPEDVCRPSHRVLSTPTIIIRRRL